MALVRCDLHGKPEGRIYTYNIGVRPVGYPDTSAICGLSRCENPGLVWLTEEEHLEYVSGQRILRVPNQAVKIKVA